MIQNFIDLVVSNTWVLYYRLFPEATPMRLKDFAVLVRKALCKAKTLLKIQWRFNNEVVNSLQKKKKKRTATS